MSVWVHMRNKEQISDDADLFEVHGGAVVVRRCQGACWQDDPHALDPQDVTGAQASKVVAVVVHALEAQQDSIDSSRQSVLNAVFEVVSRHVCCWHLQAATALSDDGDTKHLVLARPMHSGAGLVLLHAPLYWDQSDPAAIKASYPSHTLDCWIVIKQGEGKTACC